MTNYKNEKICYSQQIAIELRKRGFKIKRTEVNHRYPQYDVYIFDESDELEQNFEQILAERIKEKERTVDYGYKYEDKTVCESEQKADETSAEQPKRKLRLCRSPFKRDNQSE